MNIITSRITFLLCLAASGCRTGKLPATTVLPKPDPTAFVDVQPGWRLRVITPLVLYDGYKVRGTERQKSNTISIQTDKDFVGFETSYYDVLGDSKVRFVTAEFNHQGKILPREKPARRLFRQRRGTKHVRLVYLERGSSTIHEMAVLMAPDRATLEALTAKARANDCQAGCEWVPAGIAVRAEKQSGGAWVPAH
jgi:hypothetical protein